MLPATGRAALNAAAASVDCLLCPSAATIAFKAVWSWRWLLLSLPSGAMHEALREHSSHGLTMSRIT